MGTEQEFDDKYLDSCVTNPFVEDAGWNGCVFETYGQEREFVQEVARENPKKVWTIIDGDEGDYVVAGFHHVNAYNYLICEKEWESIEEEYKLESF